MKTDDARPPGAASDPPPADAVLQQLGRVLASPGFSTARSRARFLEYVVARTLAGAEDGLKEYTIGVEVFDRGPEFDPKSDGVVRTQAGLLRKHLDRYYADEGRADPIVIEVPKGHYVPRFHARAASEGPARPGPVRVRPLAWSSIAVVLTAVLFVTATRARDRGPGAAPRAAPETDPLYAPVWAPFLQPGASNMLAFGTPQFFTAGQVWVRDVNVNTPAQVERGRLLPSFGRIVGKTLEPRENYTGIGEAYGVYLLSRFFLEKSRDLRVVRSRTVSWDNLKHDNVIFLTSARFRTLADQLTYPSDFVHVLGVPNHVENRRPAGNELGRYDVPPGGEDNVDHAIVTVWPAPVPGRRVMVLSGSQTWGTQAAAEYVTEPGHLRDLNRHLAGCALRQGARAHTEFFQVLLRVEIRDHEPVSIAYVTHHDLSLEPAATSVTGDRTALRLR